MLTGLQTPKTESLLVGMYLKYSVVLYPGVVRNKLVALPSSEAEYIALSYAVSEALWIIGILIDLHVVSEHKSVSIYEDNRGCIGIAKNTESKRSKHIDIKFHLRDNISNGIIKLEQISTEEQLADMFTKDLDTTKFMKFRKDLQLSD